MAPHIEIKGKEDCLWTYVGDNGRSVNVAPPRISLDGEGTTIYGDLALESEQEIGALIVERVYSGQCSGLELKLVVRITESPVVRFKYVISGTGNLTRPEGKDEIHLARVAVENETATEVRLSDYSSLYHAYVPTEVDIQPHHFNNKLLATGPILTWSTTHNGESYQTLLAYEHGSQWPDTYLGFHLDRGSATVVGVKGTYDTNHDLSSPFETAWLQLMSIKGALVDARHVFRSYILERFCPYPASRQPRVFYNTWNNQERVRAWQHQPYLYTMREEHILAEVDAASAMGIEVFVLDVGWFESTGDWRVSSDRFPSGLRPIKKRLDSHNMELGLWFGPTTAALSSEIYQKNQHNRMSWRGRELETRAVWETEESAECCLVSSYAEDFANQLIRCAQEYGVTYFKWDAVEQYGCDDDRHHHGNAHMSHEERADRYAYLMPIAMASIVEKLQRHVPNAIVDFDVTESARCVGLTFLSVGKYFSVNNGPYYFEYDIPSDTKPSHDGLPAASQNAMKLGTTYDNINIFFHSGSARSAICRTGLDYDKWIPSTLFLVHYLPDDQPVNNQLISLGSLLLGHGGIWGDINKVSDEGKAKFKRTLELYRKVREAATRVGLDRIGQYGGMLEAYDKVDPASGEGLVVIFTGRKLDKFWGGGHDVGVRTAITSIATRATGVSPKYKAISSEQSEVVVEFDNQGRATVTLKSTEVSAAIVFFGNSL